MVKNPNGVGQVKALFLSKCFRPVTRREERRNFTTRQVEARHSRVDDKNLNGVGQVEV